MPTWPLSQPFEHNVGYVYLHGGTWPAMRVDWSALFGRGTFRPVDSGVVDIGAWPVWRPGDMRPRPAVLLTVAQTCGGVVPATRSGDTAFPGSWGLSSFQGSCRAFGYSFIPLSPGVKEMTVSMFDSKVTLRGTGVDRPGVELDDGAAPTPSGATIRARVNPAGLETTAYVEYGLTTDYTRRTEPRTLPPSFTGVVVSSAVSRLSAGTTYHYRVVATNAEGMVISGDRMFRTPKRPALVVSVAGKGLVTVDGARCRARCTITLETPKKLVLSATPQDGATFVEWRGDCRGAYARCPMTVDRAATVAAVFGKSP